MKPRCIKYVPGSLTNIVKLELLNGICQTVVAGSYRYLVGSVASAVPELFVCATKHQHPSTLLLSTLPHQQNTETVTAQ